MPTTELTDSRGRVLKVGSRVRGEWAVSPLLTTHGRVVGIIETPKHGTCLAIEDFDTGNVNHLPVGQCKRMYGETRRTRML